MKLSIFPHCRRAFFIVLLLLSGFSRVHATAISAVATGNWSSTSTWSTGTVPTSTDDVTIDGGYTVTEDATGAACLGLTIGSSTTGALVFSGTTDLYVHGVLTVGGSSAGGTLTLLSTSTLTVTGLALGTSPSITWNSGTLQAYGTWTMPSGITAIDKLTIELSAVITLSNNLTLSYLFMPGSATLIPGTASPGYQVSTTGSSISGTLEVLSVNHTDDFQYQYPSINAGSASIMFVGTGGKQYLSHALTAVAITVQNDSGLVINNDVTITTSSSFLTANDITPSKGSIIHAGSSISALNSKRPTLYVTATGNANDLGTQYNCTSISALVVNFCGTAAQTSGVITSPYGLIISNTSGPVSFTASVTSMGAGGTVVNSGATLSMGVSVQLPGALSGPASGAPGTIKVNTNRRSNDLAYNYKGTLDLSNLIVVFASAPQTGATASGSPLSCYGLVIACPGNTSTNTVTFNNNVTVGAGGITITSGNLIMGATNTMSGNISGTGGTIKVTAVGHSNDLTTQYTGTLDLTNIAVQFGGSGTAQAINSAITCAGLTASNTTGITLSGDVSVSGNVSIATNVTLTVGSSATFTPAASSVISGAGTLTGSGTIKITATGNTNDLTTQYAPTTLTLTNLKLDFAGAGNQAISAGISCAGITISNTAGTVTFNGNATVSGTTTINSGGVLALGAANTLSGAVAGAGTLTIMATGNTNDLTTQYTGSLTLTSLTLNFAGAGAQAIDAAINCKSINITNSAGAVTLNGDASVSNNVTIGTGAVLTIGSGKVFNPTATSVISGSGTLNGSGIIKISDTSHTNDLTAQYTVATLTLTNLTLDFSGAGRQAVNADPACASMRISNAAAPVTFNTSATVSGTTTVNNRAVLIMSPSSILSGAVAGAGTIVVTATGNTNDLTTQYTGTITVLNIKFAGSGTGQHVPTGTYTTLTANNANGVTLNGDITVSDSVLLSGGSITLGSHNLVLNSGAAAVGGSSSSYLKITGAGRVIAKNITSSTLIPVGDDYSPVQIGNGGGADYTIGLQDTVTDNGGSPILSSHAVGITWSISASTTVSNVDITLQWPASMELSSFDRNNSYLAYRTSPTGTWIPLAAGGAASGTDPYTQTATMSSMTGGVTYYFGIGDGSGSSALPVTLLQFEAVAEANTAILNWKTASEINNSYFEIQRSANAQRWQPVGKVNGHGTATTANSYTATDNLQGMAIPNTLYYRLKQVDYNGNSSYSDMKAVHFNTASASMLTVYPNPAAGSVNILWQNTGNEPAMLKIMNIAGQTIYTETVAGSGAMQHTLNLSSYPAGAYEVQVLCGGKVQVERVWKE